MMHETSPDVLMQPGKMFWSFPDSKGTGFWAKDFS